MTNRERNMKLWTENTAKKELFALIEEIESLKEKRRYCAEHTRWHMRVLRILKQVFGENSMYLASISVLPWQHTGPALIGGLGDWQGARNPQAAIERLHQKSYVENLDTAKGLLQAAIDELDRAGIDAVYEGKDTGPESSEIIKILNLIERKLRRLIRVQPEKERNIQDYVENLLIGADITYSRETESIEYSSKTYIPDFSFQKLDLVLEIKFCNRVDREKNIIAEINDDILAYSTKYGNLIFVVYDLGFIRDVDKFISHFEDNEGVVVRVIKH